MFRFRICASLIIFVGAVLSLDLVWNLADVLMGVMAIINIPSILLMHKSSIKCLDDYCAQKKAGKNPVFKASTIGLENKVDFWN